MQSTIRDHLTVFVMVFQSSQTPFGQKRQFLLQFFMSLNSCFLMFVFFKKKKFFNVCHKDSKSNKLSTIHKRNNLSK